MSSTGLAAGVSQCSDHPWPSEPRVAPASESGSLPIDVAITDMHKLVDAPGGCVTAHAFGDARIARAAFPPGRLVNFHGEPQAGLQFAFCLSGAEIGLDERTETLRRGDLLVIDMAHAVSLSSSLPTTWIALSIPRSLFIDRLAGAPAMPPLIADGRLPLTKLLRSCLLEIWRAGAQTSDAWIFTVADAKVELAAQVLQEAVEAKTGEPGRTSKLFEASAIIKRHLADGGFGPSDLARELGVLPTELKSLLGGQSPALVIRDHRLCFARRLLRSRAAKPVSIGEIARSAGFASLTYFSTIYTRTFGLPPTSERSLG